MSPDDLRFDWKYITKSRDDAANRKRIDIQFDLREYWGYKSVEPDGHWGPKSDAAIKHWRYENGLDPSGPMTKADLRRLHAGPTAGSAEQEPLQPAQ
jgi:peptidoglycan hydrolase-like protein with peptidoglycan-binding domain